MLIGCARTSTLDQVAGFDAKRKELAEIGCKKVRRTSQFRCQQAKARAALDELREGERLRAAAPAAVQQSHGCAVVAAATHRAFKALRPAHRGNRRAARGSVPYCA